MNRPRTYSEARKLGDAAVLKQVFDKQTDEVISDESAERILASIQSEINANWFDKYRGFFRRPHSVAVAAVVAVAVVVSSPYNKSNNDDTQIGALVVIPDTEIPLASAPVLSHGYEGAVTFVLVNELTLKTHTIKIAGDFRDHVFIGIEDGAYTFLTLTQGSEYETGLELGRIVLENERILIIRDSKI